MADVVRSFSTHLVQVADLGCGPGDIAIRLGRAAATVRITGVDGRPRDADHRPQALRRGRA